MKLLFITIFITLIKYIFCSKDRGNFLELNNVNNVAYLVAESCEKVYICSTHHREGFLIIDDILDNCYYRNKKLDHEINLSDDKFDNPNNCAFYDYAYILSSYCSMSSNGSNEIKGITESVKALYYDIDINNKRVLTEWGWCNYVHDLVDANWMSCIDDDLKLNQINIPGTHDSGTADIGYGYFQKIEGYNPNTIYELGKLYNSFSTLINEITFYTAQTQYLSITDQLESGIRYLDIRLALDSKNKPLYLSHGPFECYDDNTQDKLYFESVIKYCVDFLVEHPTETIILHLKIESIKDKIEDNDVAEKIELISNKEYKENIQYKEFFYFPDDIDLEYSNDHIPTLKDVRGKIVFFSRSEFYYSNKYIKPIDINEAPVEESKQSKNKTLSIGFLRDLKDKGKCTSDPLGINYNICKPEEENNFRYQDDYNLKVDLKWLVVYDMLLEESNFNDEFYSLTHTLNFMNVAFINNLPIQSGADNINNLLYEFLKYHSVSNEWFVLDFPSPYIIRSIYKSNKFMCNTKIINSDKTLMDILEDKIYDNISDVGDQISFYINTFLDIFKSDSNHDELRKRNTNIEFDEKLIKCLQRKIIHDEQGNQRDVIKTNYKCVDNNLNKWYIKQINNDFYSIISVYDNKCLTYSEDGLYIEKCKKNNEYQEFTIKDKNNSICPRLNIFKCLNSFAVYPIAKRPKKYNNLKCSINFARFGIKCCDNQSTEVKYVDENGNWGIENGKLCGIGYERCSFAALDEPYPCCSSVNPEIIYTDENGKWGYEDGQWCGIGEIVYKSSIRIKNKKTQECLITNLHSDTNILLMGDCNHSEWTYKNDNFVLDATGKCLYAMNSQNARMIECNKADDQINHHIHFKIVANKYICIKNNVDPEDHCLNGSTLNFETGKNEYSEWIIEKINSNNKIIDSIEEIVKNNPSLRDDKSKPTTTIATTTIKPTSSSDCYFEELGYPCCPPEITEIVYVDENGNWGYNYDKNDWCGIIETKYTTTVVKKTTTTTTIKSTTTSTKKTSLTTSSLSTPELNPNAKLVWIYNMKLNECLNSQTIVDKKPKIYECGKYTNHRWYIDPYPIGYIRSYAFPERCITILDVPNGKVKVTNCTINDNNNNIFEITNEGFIKSILSNECMGKGDRLNDPTNADGGYLKTCTASADDQLWQMWEKFPNDIVNAENKTVWIYNPKLKKCIYSGTKDTYRPYIGNCNDTNKKNKWNVPVSLEGFYKSVANNFCFTVTNINKGTVINTSCSNASIIKYNKNNKNINSSLNKKKCLGLLNNGKNEIKLGFNDCDTTKDDQYWEILETSPNKA